MRISRKNALFLAFLFLLESCGGLFYRPSREVFLHPELTADKPDDLFLPGPEGKKLHAFYFHHHGEEPTHALVIFYHGNGQNITAFFPRLLWLLEQPYDFLIFDYEGYGLSEGSASAEHTVKDGEAVLRWARLQNPTLPLVVYAHSLGGEVALRNAIDFSHELKISLVMVDGTFASYQRIGRRKLAQHILSWPFQWLPWILVSDHYAAEGEIAKIAPVPLIVAHGTADPIVEVIEGEEIFAEAASPKEFWKIEGGKHEGAFAHPDYRKAFVAAMEKAIKGSP